MVRLSRHRPFLALCVAAVTGLCGTRHAGAVIVDGPNGTGTANVLPTNPPSVAGWTNVGTIDNASGVYLGNRWGITASHIASGAVINPGQPFTLPSGQTFLTDQTSVRLVNPSDNSPTDILMFHLAADPGLPTLSIAASSPALGTPIITMGYGQTRSASQQFYSVTGTGAATVWTPLPNSTGSNASGYTESPPQVDRWGTNLTTAPPGVSTPTTVINAGSGNITVFASTFDSGLPTASESQVSVGDSGGGVFNSSNVLLGLNNVEFTFTNQPANTAIFGDQSAYADLATYRTQILSVSGIPEPGSAALLAAGGLLLLRRRRQSAGAARGRP